MKNLKLGKRVIAILLGSIVIGGTLVGCTNTRDVEQSSISMEDKKVFGPGEHILYKRIDTKSNDERLEYHEGYEIVGVSSRRQGSTKIIYVNTTEVECIPSKCKDGYDYVTFGEPLIREEKLDNEQFEIVEGSTREFDVGEHILYKNIDTEYNDERLDYHDGYTLVAISSRSQGSTKAIYVNNVPVSCVATKSGKGYDYISFGEQILYTDSQEKNYTLK